MTKLWLILVGIFVTTVVSVDVEGSYKQFVVLEELSTGEFEGAFPHLMFLSAKEGKLGENSGLWFAGQFRREKFIVTEALGENVSCLRFTVN